MSPAERLGSFLETLKAAKQGLHHETVTSCGPVLRACVCPVGFFESKRPIEKYVTQSLEIFLLLDHMI